METHVLMMIQMSYKIETRKHTCQKYQESHLFNFSILFLFSAKKINIPMYDYKSTWISSF